MKILHCIANMAGGGAERQCSLLARAQVDRGDEVHVALIDGGPNLQFLEESGAQLHWIRSRSYHNPFIVSQLLRLMKQLAPDVVQTWLLQMDVVAGLASRWSAIPWILSERSSGVRAWGKFKWWLRRRLGRRASMIVANSAAGAAFWRREVGNTPSTHVVPNIVPFEAIDAALGLGPVASNGEPLVLYAGRLNDGKNLKLLLEAFRQALPETNARAMLCGAGPLELPLRQMAQALGLGDRVQVVEYRNDLWSLMKSAAVFVSVSHFEGHPNTVLEAMACRCPVVVSDIPEHREFLDETAAWLVDRQSAPAVARAIAEALADRSTAVRKAEIAWQRVKEYSAEACAERYATIYEQACRPVAISA